MWAAVGFLAAAAVVGGLCFAFSGDLWLWLVAAAMAVVGTVLWVRAGAGSTATTSQHPFHDDSAED